MIRLDDEVRITGKTLLVTGLVIFALFTRFYDLESRPFHHDESQYVKYSYDLYIGNGYQYNPMLHGPFLFHLNAVIFFLFGDSDFTSRIAPALLGVLMVLLPFTLKKQLTFYGAFAVGLLFAISPTFMFYTRFTRMDIYAAITTFASVISFIYYYETRKPRYVYFLAVSLSLLFCSKENSYVHTAIFIAFFITFIIHRKIVRGSAGKGIALGILITVMVFAFFSYLHTQSITYLYLFLISTAGLMLFSLILLFQKDDSEDLKEFQSFLAAHWGKLIFACFIFWGVFFLLYTTFFTNLGGFLDGIYRKSLPYWIDQNKKRRITGPFDFYLYLLFLYELPILLVMMGGLIRKITENFKQFITLVVFAFASVIILIFWGTRPAPAAAFLHCDQYQHVVLFAFALLIGVLATFQYFRENDYFTSFLVFWSMTAFIAYSYLGEKVPWLVMHVVTPQILLAGKYVGQFVVSADYQKRRKVWIVLMSLGVLFLTRNALLLSFRNYADPVERMHHTQTTFDTARMVDIMKDFAFRIQTDEPDNNAPLKQKIAHFYHWDVPLGMVIDCKAVWPTSWYLRHYTNWTIQKDPETFDRPLVCIDYAKRDDHIDMLKEHYSEIELKYWAMIQTETHKGSWWDELKYFLVRKPFGTFGYERVLLYLRKDVTSGISYAPSLEKSEIIKQLQVRGSWKSIFVQPALEFGRYGRNEGDMSSPKDLAIDPRGNVFVVDSKNNRIQKFSPEGKFLLAWGTLGNNASEFNDPSGIACDSKGNVYITDTWNHRIQKFDGNGKFISSWNKGEDAFWAPKGIAISKDGFIYITDTGRHRVQKFDLNGNFISGWGSQGKLKNRFDEPVGIDITADNKVYIADTVNKRIQIFGSNGTFIDEWGVKGWPNRLDEPFIAADDQKHLFVSDPENHRIEVFSASGELIYMWGQTGTGKGEFQKPKGITVHGDKLYLVDFGAHRVQVFNLADIFSK